MRLQVNKWMGEALNGFFPQHCLLCGRASHHSLPLCHPCRAELPRNGACCPQCALPQGVGALCGRCLAAPPPFDSALAPYLYDEQLALLVRRWKYHPDPRLGRLMAALWLGGVARQALPEVDLALPVPLHWRKLLRRGFNQAGQLCAGLCAGHPALAGQTPHPRLLRRHRATAVQAGLDARQRRGNLRGAFTLRGRCDNLRIALVDDVMTTGATAGELARCLKSGGAREVHLWCLARTPAPPD